MKKRLLCLLLVLVTALAFCVSAAAAAQTGAQLNYVTDAAGLLREGERARLEKMAEAVSQKYRVGVYIVTVEDFRDYHADGVYKATYTIYHNYTMGEGPNRDGIMLLLSMDDRDWAMFCYGKRCEYAFNSYGQEKLEKVFLDNFGENDWYGGFEDYVKECRVYLEKGFRRKARPGELVLSAPYRDRSFPAGSSRGRRCDMAENGHCIRKSNRERLRLRGTPAYGANRSFYP